MRTIALTLLLAGCSSVTVPADGSILAPHDAAPADDAWAEGVTCVDGMPVCDLGGVPVCYDGYAPQWVYDPTSFRCELIPYTPPVCGVRAGCEHGLTLGCTHQPGTRLRDGGWSCR